MAFQPRPGRGRVYRPTDHWHLAFQGNVHTLGEADFATIENAVRAAARTPVGAT